MACKYSLLNSKDRIPKPVLSDLLSDNLTNFKQGLTSLQIDADKIVSCNHHHSEILSELLYAAVFRKAFACTMWLLNVNVQPDGFRDPKHRSALLIAAKNGSLDILRILLEHKADVNQVDKFGETALIICARLNYSDCLDLLLQYGAHTNVQGGFNQETALTECTSHGHDHCIPLLLDAGANVDCQNGKLETPLMLAAEIGHLGCVKYLVSRGADCFKESITQKSPLFYAVYNGHYDVAKWLIKYDCRLDNVDSVGNTILAASFCSGNKKLVMLFLDMGASMNSVLDLVSITQQCVEKGGESCLEILLECSSDVKDKVNDLIFSAVMGDNLECVKVLLKHGADINIRNHNNINLIHQATDFRAINCLNFFLEHNVDVNVRNNYGETPLFYVAAIGEEKVTKILLRHGADVNMKNKTGMTVAMKTACIEILSLLIEAGLDIHIQDENGMSAIMHASDVSVLDSVELVEFYLQRGAEIDLSDIKGRTALIHAAKNGAVQTLTFLIEKGANICHFDHRGKSALENCVESALSPGNTCEMVFNEYKKCFQILLQHMPPSSKDIICRVLQLVSLKQNWHRANSSKAKLVLHAQGFIEVLFQFKIKFPHIFSWFCEEFATIASLGEKRIIQCLLLNGVYPKFGVFKVPESTSTLPNPPIETGVLKYFIVNNLLNDSDLKLMRECYRVSCTSLVFQRKRDTEQRVDEAESCQQFLFQDYLFQPEPLVKLSLRAVSECVGYRHDYKQLISCCGLPPKLQRSILHDNDTLRLCPSQWDNIPIITDPIKYEQLPRPRPLLEQWPAGHGLEKCRCFHCGQDGLKMSGVECDLDTETQFDELDYFFDQLDPNSNFDDTFEQTIQRFAFDGLGEVDTELLSILRNHNIEI